MAQRAKPFSGKKKKQQLQEKRARKAGLADGGATPLKAGGKSKPAAGKGGAGRGRPGSKADGGSKGGGGRPPKAAAAEAGGPEDLTRGRKMQFVPGACTADGHPLKTVFAKEEQSAVEARILASHEPIRERLRVEDGPSRESGDSFYSVVIDFPHRPPWHASMSADELDKRERHYFNTYLQRLYDRYPSERLNYFEHNIEVWRQLWRVLEMSDVLLVLADIRHPIFHFPPSLYSYVTRTLRKPMILVLNKIDLVPVEVVDEWKLYFTNTYPELQVVAFSNYPRSQDVGGELTTETLDVGGKIKRGRKRYGDARGIAQLLTCCGIAASDAGAAAADVVAATSSSSSSSRHSRNNDSDNSDNDDDDDDDTISTEEDVVDGLHEDDDDDEYGQRPASAKPKYTTIGLIGHPNVGKSSIINSLKKKKVVSTSRTPGHTKHFQTIFLSPTVRLCDSPGLIFPALDMPKELQVLSGLYPIAQTREPYSAVGFLAKRVPIERVYGLTPVDETADPNTFQWSAWDLCEAYAKKRCYTTKRGRFDVYRAGNEILRDCLDGVVLLYFAPPLRAMRTEAEDAAHSSDHHNDNQQHQVVNED